MTRPGWSHRDGSSLCPVLSPDGGYRPAQPKPAEPGATAVARPDPEPERQPDDRDLSRFGPLYDSEGQLIEGPIDPPWITRSAQPNGPAPADGAGHADRSGRGWRVRAAARQDRQAHDREAGA